MGRWYRDSLLGLIFVACLVTALLAALAFAAPTILPEPFAGRAASSDLWIAGTAALTIVGVMFVLLALRMYV